MTLASIESSLLRASLKRSGPEDPLRLLVSVRDAEEALIAVAAGVEVIDVKEPSRGALGRADDDTLRQIAEAVDGRAILSYAAGEAIERGDVGDADCTSSLPLRLGYALSKYGPAGLAHREDWREILTEAWRSSVEGAAPIAVAYVDYAAADAPPPEAIVELAIERGCAGMLFDTFGKAPGLGLTALPTMRLRDRIRRASDAGLIVSLAGSLGADEVAEVRQLGADIIAVRGAACAGDRTGRIDGARIAALKEAVARDAACSVGFDVEAIAVGADDRRSRVD